MSYKRTLYGNASADGVMYGAPLWRLWYGTGARVPLHTFLFFILLDTLVSPIVMALKDSDRSRLSPRTTSLTTDVLRGAATLQVSYHTNQEHSYLDEVGGFYSVAGSSGDAQGKPQQIHPLSCDSMVDDHVPRPWVAIIILEVPNVTAASDCGQVYSLTLRAQQHGASAVVLDVRDNRVAAKQLSLYKDTFKVPVILVQGEESIRLRQIIQYGSLNRSSVYVKPRELLLHKDQGRGPTTVMVIVGMVLFLLLLCGVTGLLIKFKCHSKRQPSMADVAKGILSKMGTRKFVFLETLSESDRDTCAVCLEDYKEGQELRILPCGHEFHKLCVDPWLIANRTCPLCMYNITENPQETEGSLCSSEHQRAAGVSPVSQLSSRTVAGRQAGYGPLYSPLANITGLPGYPYHSGRAGGSSYHQIYVSHLDHLVPVHTSCVTGSQQHPNVYLRPHADPHRRYPEVAGSYYNILPLSPSKPGEQVSPEGPSPVQCDVLASESVQKAPSHKQTSAMTRNKGIYSTGQHRRRPPGRHKVASSSTAHLKGRTDTRTHIHTPNRRPAEQATSSSDSEFEVRLNRSTSSRPKLQHYASSHLDADVSETSTGAPSGVDSDGPHMGASRGVDSDRPHVGVPRGVDSDRPSLGSASSHLDLSNKSVFGSSDVPSDISSCDSNVYCHDQFMNKRQCLTSGDSGACTVSHLSPGVHLKPACMSTSSRKSAMSRKRQTSKSVPYSVILPSKGGRCTRLHSFSGLRYVHPPASLEDSDHTVSSLHTSDISPHISGFSHSSESDTSPLPAASRQLTPNMTVCPQCHSGNNHPMRSDPSTVPLLAPSTVPLLAPEEVCSKQGACRLRMSGPTQNLCPAEHTEAVSRYTHTACPAEDHSSVAPPHHPTALRHGPVQYEWETFNLLAPQVTSEDFTESPRETVSKAGSTCSFYCYPSNQQSSSASSSPMHQQKNSSEDGVSASSGSVSRALIVHSSTTGDASTSSVPSSSLLPSNIV